MTSLFRPDLSRTRRQCEEIIRKDPEELIRVANLLGVEVVEAPSPEEIVLANIHEQLERSSQDEIIDALNGILHLLPPRFETYFVCSAHPGGGWSRVSRDFLTRDQAQRHSHAGRFIQREPRNVIQMRMWLKQAEKESSGYPWEQYPLEPEEEEAIEQLKKFLY